MSRITDVARLAAAVCVVVTATSARAQDSATVSTLAAPPLQSLLARGRFIRLHLTTGRVTTGRVRVTSDTAVVLSECNTCARQAVRFVDVAGVDTLIGKPHQLRHVLVGALVGGAALVGAVAVAGTRSDRHCHDGPCGVWIVAVPPAFGLGVLLGAGTGALLPAEHWGPTPFMYRTSADTTSR